MYGLIGKMRAARGQRDAIMDVLLASTGALPGCLSYIIARDPADADAIWVTEVWTDADEPQGVAAAAGSPGGDRQGAADHRRLRIPGRDPPRRRLRPGRRQDRLSRKPSNREFFREAGFALSQLRV